MPPVESESEAEPGESAREFDEAGAVGDGEERETGGHSRTA